MKLLTTEQQTQLRQLLETVMEYEGAEGFNEEFKSELAYWAQELKPKRVRKKVDLIVDNHQ